MSQNYTVWSNMVEGVMLFSCTKLTSNGNPNPLGTAQCIGVRTNFAIAILMMIPLLKQIYKYRKYYSEWLKHRQRIVHEAFFVTLLTICTYTIFNILQLFTIQFVILQLLFWDVLNYVTVKARNLSGHWFLHLCIMLTWTYPICLMAFFVFALFRSLPPGMPMCPSVSDKDYLYFKIVLLGGIFFLYCLIGKLNVLVSYFQGCTVNHLLTKEANDNAFDSIESKEKKKWGVTKLRVLAFFVAFSQTAQLVVSIFHYMDTPTACDLTNFDSQGIIDTTISVCYKIVSVYAPVMSIVGMFWLSESDLETTRFTESYEDHAPANHSKLYYSMQHSLLKSESKPYSNLDDSSMSEDS